MHPFECGYPIFLVSFFERTVLFPLNGPGTPKIFDRVCKGLFLGSLSSPLFYLSVFMPTLNCFYDGSFVVSLKSESVTLPTLLLSFKILLAIQSGLRFQ